GFTSASWIAYSTQNAVRPMNSPGSNQTGDSVTYSAQRISPSGFGCDVGFVWAADSPTVASASVAQSSPTTTADRYGIRCAGLIVSLPARRGGTVMPSTLAFS